MSGNEVLDPEGSNGLLDPDDPEGSNGLLDPDDPEGSNGLLDPDDPEGSNGLLDPDDPEGSNGLLDPDDPEGSNGLLDPDDPTAAGAREASALRRAQRSRVYGPKEADNTGIPPAEQRYSGDVIVRLSSLLPRHDANDLSTLATALALPGLAALLERFGSPVSARAIQAEAAGTPCGDLTAKGRGSGSLNALEKRAARSTHRPLHSLWAYWRIDARQLTPKTAGGTDVVSEDGFPPSNDTAARKLVEQLNALSEVDLAYREFAASDPMASRPDPFTTPSDEPLADFQFYLEDGPLGLGADWAREFLKHANGEITVADLEQGWLRGHDDLSVPTLVHGDNRDGVGGYRGDHGTAVVSQLFGLADNQVGGVGIASGVATLALASHYRSGQESPTGTNGHVADAIAALLAGEEPKLKPGDILLLEVQRAGQPTEVDPLDLDAIRLAVAAGVIVIEPAGNGRINLNRLQTVDGRVLRPRSVHFVDSGAIMVGAARSAAPHNRLWFSNFGARVDCFAWGDSVVAAGYGDLQDGEDRELFTDRFSGTSSAAPMIAGAAALIQAQYRRLNAGTAQGAVSADAERWRRLSPGQMRSLLSDPSTGTLQGRGVGGRIGVMPNLRSIFGRVLGIVPQLYLRDHVGDGGGSTRRRYASPDIIVTRTPSAQLAEKFGTDGPFANRDTFDVGLTANGPKYVCVRACNQGLVDATSTTARLYTAPVCTLVTPDRWQELESGNASVASSLELGKVPPGDAFVVSSAVSYEASKPRSLVAVLAHDGGQDGPTPCSASNFNWARYLRTMRMRRDVAVRNLHDCEVGEQTERRLEFKINGTSDAARAFEFEMIRRLPAGVTIELETHSALALKFARGRLWNVAPQGDRGTLKLPVQPRLPLGSAPLPAAMDFESAFVLRGAEAIRPGHSLAIRQLYRGEEVGRITWRFGQAE